jgi:hypothetical protein
MALPAPGCAGLADHLRSNAQGDQADVYHAVATHRCPARGWTLRTVYHGRGDEIEHTDTLVCE